MHFFVYKFGRVFLSKLNYDFFVKRKKRKGRKKYVDTKNILDPVLAFKDFQTIFFRTEIPKDS